MSIVFGNFSLTVGSLGLVIFVGYKWGIKPALAEIEQEGVTFGMKNAWATIVRFVAPAGILLILGYIIATGNFF